MWKYCLFVSFLTVSVNGAQNTISSNSEGYYHYPAPPRTQQFIAPAPKPIQYSQGAAYKFQFNSPQQNKQPNYQQSSYFHPSSGYSYYGSSSASSASSSSAAGPSFPSSSVVSQQFASPALENAAFTMALTNQGYKTVSSLTPSASNSIALKAAPAASQASTPSSSAQLSLLSATPSSSGTSLNVKLPLPFNITPLNIAPLPLQAGAPYAKLPQGVTSYGTVYPQRRRR
ncbi:uncharacterized protein LOC142234737 [Haematobia irritans]|uniref:uncharacterized protein LOC142234737 n=1 Tax=Haematobia irritans TaxID=7368 RepID=UPI003F50591E